MTQPTLAPEAVDDARRAAITRFLADEFADCDVPSPVLDQFLACHVQDQKSAVQVLQTRLQQAQWMLPMLGCTSAHRRDVLKLALTDTLQLPTTALVARQDVRDNLVATLSRVSADRPPARPVLFDHITKTGGSTIVAALQSIFPQQIVSPRFDLAAERHGNAPVDGNDLSRWPIICGHIGRRHHGMIADLSRRLTCTIVRDPVSRARSIYTYFRYNVTPSHPAYEHPDLVAARTQEFASFIRNEQVRRRISNPQFRTISATDPTSDEIARIRERQVAELLDTYELVGITDRLASFFAALLTAMDVTVPGDPQQIIDRSSCRQSLGTVEITEADKALIESLNPLDRMLYEEARRRSAPSQTLATRLIAGRLNPSLA